MSAALLLLSLLFTPSAQAAEVVYGPEPIPAFRHVHEETIYGRGLHAERHYKAARWLRRGELAACGMLPLLIPDDIRRAGGTSWVGSVAPAVCSLGFGGAATNHILKAADLAYNQRAAVTKFSLRAAVLRNISTAIFMATWGDFVSFGRLRNWQPEQRRRTLLITSVSLTLITIPLERAAWRSVHASIAGSLPEPPPRQPQPAER